MFVCAHKSWCVTSFAEYHVFPPTGGISILHDVLSTLHLPSLHFEDSQRRRVKEKPLAQTVVNPALISLQWAVRGNDSLCSCCCCEASVISSFSERAWGKICMPEKEREEQCSGEEAEWFDTDFRAPQRNTLWSAFVMYWVQLERMERQISLKSTPPVAVMHPHSLSESPPPPPPPPRLLWAPPASSLFKAWAGEAEVPWQQWARSKNVFLI